ncbi:CC/Se motif family (seleno)protein [Rubrivirga sp. S365]|uniref:CC/Se motif family (seleno)protein n=1 Tax=Rubrivirga sp. S365 TaxID=3076080 RepID=UPI0028C9F16D|nr:CC/Se motif family (seleno)protein [Rubrivirga sp. S365]MDT7858390.1 CC/Se motif family (seleno)protein [Rubrivirga sp. S365]
MTPVELTPEAAAFVRQRGGALTLRRAPRHGCCGGTVHLAVAEAVAPPDGAEWRDLDTPGGPVRLFLDPDVLEDVLEGGPLRVGLDRLFGLAALYVEGARL